MSKETEQLVYLRSLLAERNLEIDNLNKELERVKQIARDRLDKIAKLQHDVAVFEDKLEDTRSDVRYIQEATGRALTR
jgi:ribosome recycling factor